MPLTPPSNFPWSSTANYPAGSDPWSGQPTKVAPVDSTLTPGVGLPATNVNKILFDRDTYLAAVVTFLGGATPSAVTRVMESTPVGQGWILPPPSGNVWEISGGAGATLWIPLSIPHGATLTSVTVRYKGVGGHAPFPGGAPSMPVVNVFKMEKTTGAENLIADDLDTSATAGAYEVVHPIVCTVASEVIDRVNKQYYVAIYGAENGDKYYCLEATFTPGAALDLGTA